MKKEQEEMDTIMNGNEQGLTEFEPVKIGLRMGYASYRQS
jgi:hypothetical protein